MMPDLGSRNAPRAVPKLRNFLVGLAEPLEYHTGEVFSRIIDPGHLRSWERARRGRNGQPMLWPVE